MTNPRGWRSSDRSALSVLVCDCVFCIRKCCVHEGLCVCNITVCGSECPLYGRVFHIISVYDCSVHHAGCEQSLDHSSQYRAPMPGLGDGGYLVALPYVTQQVLIFRVAHIYEAIFLCHVVIIYRPCPLCTLMNRLWSADLVPPALQCSKDLIHSTLHSSTPHPIAYTPLIC